MTDPVASTPDRTDACIIGGGPGGLMLALLLLRSGWDVTVAERAPSLDRAYRGEILQPSGQELLDRVGVLAGAEERGAQILERFQFLQDGRRAITSEYRRLRPPYDRLLSLPQDHLLGALLDACSAHGAFHYLPGTSPKELTVGPSGAEVRLGGRVADGAVVEAAVVIGADGRHSAVRRLAGLDFDKADGVHFDVIWCKLPEGTGTSGAVRILRSGGGPPLLAYDSWPASLQLGLTVPHGEARRLLADGVEGVRDLMAATLPEHASALSEVVRSASDLSVLDAFAGIAPRWVADRVVLIGDAAHVHSPLGAQGINLALGDAAVAHPVLHDALAAGDLGSSALEPFARRRRPAIEAVLKMQEGQAKGMLADHGPVARVIEPLIMRAVSASPVGTKLTSLVAYGRQPVGVRTDLFHERTAPPAAVPA